MRILHQFFLLNSTTKLLILMLVVIILFCVFAFLNPASTIHAPSPTKPSMPPTPVTNLDPALTLTV
ncbi:MAG: hypothetical protein MI924_10500 [Chloroflexales bacterium]|nr:hypothetical protein [Chloroflexales bacterium]